MWRSAPGPTTVRDRVVVGGAIAALALAGCSSATGPGASGIALWVDGLDRILGYTASQLQSSTSATPAVVLTAGPYEFLNGVALDARRNLWVAMVGGASGSAVVEYTASQLARGGSPMPNVTLTSNVAGSLVTPVALAFDVAGNLWVANAGGSLPGANAVVEFTASQLAASGSPTPAVTLAANAGSLNAPQGLVLDHSGNLWVTNSQSQTVVAFSASELASSGSPVPAITLSDNGSGSLSAPGALAFDVGGNLWLTSGASVVEFASSQLASTGSPTPAVTLTGATFNNCPQGLAFDGHGNLWVTNSCVVGAVLEFAASLLTASGTPMPTVTITPPGTPVALVFTP